MPALSAVAFFLQDNATMASDVHLIMVAEWVIAGFCLLLLLGLLIGAVVVLGLVRKMEKKVHDTTNLLQSKAFPLIAQGQDIAGKVQEILTDLKPKIASISSDATHISHVVKSKVDEAGATLSQVNSTVQDVNTKSKAQVQRVNGMVSDALTTTEQVSRSIQHGIKVPIQKITGWVAAAKAGIETLSERIPFLQHVAPPMRPTGTVTGTPGRPAPAARPGYTAAPGVSTYPGTASASYATGEAKQTGTATPGGPPFVPAPDASKT